MSTQDKLVEALRVAREWLNSDKWRNSTIDKHKSWEAMMRGIDAALAEYDAHAAEAAQAQAQAQSGEWVQKAIVDAKGDIEYVHVRIFNAMKARAEEAEAMLAAAPRQATESIKRVIERMDAMRWAGFSDVPLKVVANWATDLSVAIGETPFDGVAHDAHPQPAQDAKDAARYRHMIETSPLMCFGASEYHKKSDLDEAIDDSIAAMAKESGR